VTTLPAAVSRREHQRSTLLAPPPSCYAFQCGPVRPCTTNSVLRRCAVCCHLPWSSSVSSSVPTSVSFQLLPFNFIPCRGYPGPPSYQPWRFMFPRRFPNGGASFHFFRFFSRFHGFVPAVLESWSLTESPAHTLLAHVRLTRLGRFFGLRGSCR